MIADMKDRNTLKRTLQLCAHPFDMTSHDPSVLINKYTGEISPDKSNVHKSIETGNKQMKEFQESLPDGFYVTLPKKVITMDNKKAKAQLVEVYNTELIYSRVMCLLKVDQISLDDLFNSELAPVLISLFTDTGEAKYPKGKSTLKKKLKVEVSTRTHDADVIILDGCAVLYHIHWPKNACVKDLVDPFIEYVKKHLQVASVYLIFDRCRDYSIKGHTRLERLGQYARTDTLTMDAPLPTREITLKATRTKVQMINLTTRALLDNCTSIKCQNTLIVTSQDSIPIPTEYGIEILQSDMETTHEEGDVIIPQQIHIENQSKENQEF